MIYFQGVFLDIKTPSSVKLTVNLRDSNEMENYYILKNILEITYFNGADLLFTYFIL